MDSFVICKSLVISPNNCYLFLNLLRLLPGVEAKSINYSYAEALLLYDFLASGSKVQEDKRKWNLPPAGKRFSFIRRGKSLHQNQPSHRVFQKHCPVFITNKTNTRTKRLTFIFHKIPALVEFPAPWQLSKVKSRPPGQFF